MCLYVYLLSLSSLNKKSLSAEELSSCLLPYKDWLNWLKIEILKLTNEEKNTVLVFFLDLLKAFDTTDHVTLEDIVL